MNVISPGFILLCNCNNLKLHMAGLFVPVCTTHTHVSCIRRTDCFMKTRLNYRTIIRSFNCTWLVCSFQCTQNRWLQAVQIALPHHSRLAKVLKHARPGASTWLWHWYCQEPNLLCLTHNRSVLKISYSFDWRIVARLNYWVHSDFRNNW